MNALKLSYLLMFITMLTSCSFNCSVGKNKQVKGKTVSSDDNTSLTGAVIKNDIELEVTDLKVDKVYLIDADKNLLEENEARLNEKIYVIIKTDTGWVKVNGRSYLVLLKEY